LQQAVEAIYGRAAPFLAEIKERAVIIASIRGGIAVY